MALSVGDALDDALYGTTIIASVVAIKRDSNNTEGGVGRQSDMLQRCVICIKDDQPHG